MTSKTITKRIALLIASLGVGCLLTACGNHHIPRFHYYTESPREIKNTDLRTQLPNHTYAAYGDKYLLGHGGFNLNDTLARNYNLPMLLRGGMVSIWVSNNNNGDGDMSGQATNPKDYTTNSNVNEDSSDTVAYKLTHNTMELVRSNESGQSAKTLKLVKYRLVSVKTNHRNALSAHRRNWKKFVFVPYELKRKGDYTVQHISRSTAKNYPLTILRTYSVKPAQKHTHRNGSLPN